MGLRDKKKDFTPDPLGGLASEQLPIGTSQGTQSDLYAEETVPQKSFQEAYQAHVELTRDTNLLEMYQQASQLEELGKLKGRILTPEQFAEKYPDVPRPTKDMNEFVAEEVAKRHRKIKGLEEVIKGGPQDFVSRVGASFLGGARARFEDPIEVGMMAVSAATLGFGSSAGYFGKSMAKAYAGKTFRDRVMMEAATSLATDVAIEGVRQVGIAERVGTEGIEKYRPEQGLSEIFLAGALGTAFGVGMQEAGRALRFRPEKMSVQMSGPKREALETAVDVAPARMKEGLAPNIDTGIKASVRETADTIAANPNNYVENTTPIPEGRIEVPTRVYMADNGEIFDTNTGFSSFEGVVGAVDTRRVANEFGDNIVEVDVTGLNNLSLDRVIDPKTPEGEIINRAFKDLGDEGAAEFIAANPANEVLQTLQGVGGEKAVRQVFDGLKEMGYDMASWSVRSQADVDVPVHTSSVFLDPTKIKAVAEYEKDIFEKPATVNPSTFVEDLEASGPKRSIEYDFEDAVRAEREMDGFETDGDALTKKIDTDIKEVIEDLKLKRENGLLEGEDQATLDLIEDVDGEIEMQQQTFKTLAECVLRNGAET